MPFNKYYQDELSFLDDLGKEFAASNPKLAPFLANRGYDPDVERLLEGFAFIAGRLRQKLDDELPELTHTLFHLLWPHYLRPVPAMSVLQFSPVPTALTEKQTIRRGCRVDSLPVRSTEDSNPTPCHFHTCYNVDMYPLQLEHLALKRVPAGSELHLKFTLEAGTDLSKLGLDSLRLFLNGETYITYPLYLWLFGANNNKRLYLEKIVVRATGGGASGAFVLPGNAVQPVGFDEGQALLPYSANVFPGYRLLQEYFSLIEKFLFFDVTGLQGVKNFTDADGFELIFHFNKPLDDQVRLKKDHLKLYCTPIVNLFPLDASPIRMDQRRVEYLVRPEGNPPEHYELYSVDKVEGREQGTGELIRYHRFESFDHAPEDDPQRQQAYYRIRVRPSVANEQGVDTYLSFVTIRETHAQLPVETISLELTCSNRHLPEELRLGDISVATGTSPEFATFRNITVITSSLPPPMRAGLHWQLISNMSLNYISLASREALRTILSTYDFGAHYNAQEARANQLRLEGIVEVSSRPADVLHRGVPIRGMRTSIVMDESKFAGEGDMFLFACVLNEFFALYASVNSFHQLEVKGLKYKEEYQWAPRQGKQFLI